ncbi:MAG: hypothetical protein RLY43_49 [Bacteroidota bacterium]|jgi:hypothetical protein
MAKKLKMTENQFLMVKQKLSEGTGSGTVPLNYSIATQKGLSYFNLGGIDNTDKITLMQKFYAKENPKTKNLYYALSQTNSEPFLNGASFKGMYAYLESTGKYIMPSFDILKTEISQTKLDIVSPAERSEANTKYEDLLVHIITTLNSPETKELIAKISKLGIDPNISGERFGHVLSPKNVLRAFASNPSATYLATRKQWRKFNRLILPNAKRAFLFAAQPGGTYDAKKAEDRLGVNQKDAKQYQQMGRKFDIVASGEDAASSFYLVPYYDIADTFVIPGMDDKFVEEPGLVDNLTGYLNAKAQEMVGKSQIDPSVEDELGIKQTGDKNKVVFARLVNHIKQQNLLPGEIDGLMKLDPSSDNSLVDAFGKYFRNVVFAREHEYSKRELKVYAATIGLLSMEKIAPIALASLMKKHENVKQLERADIVSVFNDIMKTHKIITEDPKALNEDGGNGTEMRTPEDLLSLFGLTWDDLADGNKQDTNFDAIRENFYKTLETLNKKY